MPIFRGTAEDKEQKSAFLNTIFFFTKFKKPDDIIKSNLDSEKCDEGPSQSLCRLIYWVKIINQIYLEAM